MGWVTAVIFLAACTQGPPRPVDIDSGDACALCRMAISELRYAAELIDGEGRVFKFDDIGCMLRFARDRRLVDSTEGNVFVRDYTGGRWISAPAAHYLHSSEIPSPMASGLIAFANRPEAEQYAAKFHGGLLGFAEIWK